MEMQGSFMLRGIADLVGTITRDGSLGMRAMGLGVVSIWLGRKVIQWGFIQGIPAPDLRDDLSRWQKVAIIVSLVVLVILTLEFITFGIAFSPFSDPLSEICTALEALAVMRQFSLLRKEVKPWFDHGGQIPIVIYRKRMTAEELAAEEEWNRRNEEIHRRNEEFSELMRRATEGMRILMTPRN